MIQSISDIITNSSSKVFIIDSNKHQLVAKLIKEICEVFGYDMNKIMEFESVIKHGVKITPSSFNLNPIQIINLRKH